METATENTHGGKRKGAGRKKTRTVPLVPFSLKIEPSLFALWNATKLRMKISGPMLLAALLMGEEVKTFVRRKNGTRKS